MDVQDLKGGLKWSDGQPLTAKDAAWTFNLIMTNSTAATANGSLVSNFKSVTATERHHAGDHDEEAAGEHALRERPVHRDPDRAAAHLGVEGELASTTYKNTDFPVVGYGPWMLTGYQTDQYATLHGQQGLLPRRAEVRHS